MLLKQFNGNMDAVAEILITESSQNNKKNNNKSQLNSSSSTADVLKKKPGNINTVSVPVRSTSINSAKNGYQSPRVDSLKHYYNSPRYEYANGLNQLKAMGFTDIMQMTNALEKVCILFNNIL